MFNFFKNKPTIPENEFGITPEDIRLILKDTQTWGTDEKVFDTFIEHCQENTCIRVSKDLKQHAKEAI
jgi:hypothetical protein